MEWEKRKVSKLHVFEAPQTSLVVDVVRLLFRHFFDSSRTNVIESQHHHCERAREDGTAFHYVFIEIEQKKSGKIACFLKVAEARGCWRSGPKNKTTGAHDGSLKSP